MNKVRAVCIIVIFSVICITASADESIVLNGERDFYTIGEKLEILEDKSTELTIEDVLSPGISHRFTPGNTQFPNFGLSASAYWFRFSVKNESIEKDNILFEIFWPLYDSIQIFIENSDSTFTLIHDIGIQFPFYKRDIKHRNFLMRLNIPLNETRNYYARVKSYNSILFLFRIWKESAFHFMDHIQNYMLGIFFGIFIVMICYNLLLFTAIKDKNYIYYLIFLFFYICFEVSYTCVGFELLWYNFPLFQKVSIPLFMGSCLIVFVIFTRDFLRLKELSPFIYKLSHIHIIISATFITTIFIINPRVAMILIDFWIITGAVSIVVITLIVLKKGYKPALFYFIASIPFIISVPLLIFRNTGIFPGSNIIDYSAKIGISLQAILLSLAIGNRMNIMKAERERARKRVYENLKKSERQLEMFLLTLADAIESKDKYTGSHVERVAKYSRNIATLLKFKEKDIRQIYLGAIVHDIGKIGIRDALLNKPDRLTYEEFEEIKKHTIKGHQLLCKIEDINIPALIALYHQERWDGMGYPFGIKGEEIPLEARIVTIADYWDAMVTERSYRKAMDLREAIEQMYKEREKAFDPFIFDIFMNKNKKIFLNYIPENRFEEMDIDSILV